MRSTPFIATAAALAAWAALFFLHAVLPEGAPLARLVALLGGTTAGYIQAAVYGVTVYSFLLLRGKRRRIAGEFEALGLGILPERDQLVLTPEEVAGIKLEVIRRERAGHSSEVADLVKKACTQFRNANSVAETLQVFEAQVATRKEATEGGLEVVRYLSGAIVSLGFIGTLIGLSGSIGLSHLAATAEGMAEVTGSLNSAFDTTLVALVAGLLLNFLYHGYLRDVDTFYSRTRAYVIDNLISRIYRPREAAASTPARRVGGAYARSEIRDSETQPDAPAAAPAYGAHEMALDLTR